MIDRLATVVVIPMWVTATVGWASWVAFYAAIGILRPTGTPISPRP